VFGCGVWPSRDAVYVRGRLLCWLSIRTNAKQWSIIGYRYRDLLQFHWEFSFHRECGSTIRCRRPFRGCRGRNSFTSRQRASATVGYTDDLAIRGAPPSGAYLALTFALASRDTRCADCLSSVSARVYGAPFSSQVASGQPYTPFDFGTSATFNWETRYSIPVSGDVIVGYGAEATVSAADEGGFAQLSAQLISAAVVDGFGNPLPGASVESVPEPSTFLMFLPTLLWFRLRQ
jgi:hypothetical protein